MRIELIAGIIGLMEISALTVGGRNYLLIFEHDGTDPATGNPPMLTMTCHVWRYDDLLAKFKEVGSSEVLLPVFHKARFSSIKTDLYGVFETNTTSAAAVLKWSGINLDSLVLPTKSAITTIALSSDCSKKVIVEPSERWSVPFLPEVAWIFNPSIVARATDSSLVVTANTVNSHAFIMQSTEAAIDWKDFLIQDGMFEPVYFEYQSRRMMAYRQVPAGTNAFWNSWRYSTAAPPQALPFRLIEIDNSARIVATRTLSDNPKLGDVYMYDIATDGHDRIVLTCIAGEVDKYNLFLYESIDGGVTWDFCAREMIKSLPTHLRVTVNKSEALVAMVTQTTKENQISVARFDFTHKED